MRVGRSRVVEGNVAGGEELLYFMQGGGGEVLLYFMQGGDTKTQQGRRAN